MSLRTYLVIGTTAALLVVTGCDEDETTAEAGHEGHEDGGHDDGGHDHDDGGHDDHGDGGDCLHTGTAVECEEDIDTVGASTMMHGVTIEVTDATPEEPMAGADGDNMLMVKITGADDAGITGATLNSVFTQAHGGHEACGAPELMDMGDGMYHLHGLTYPHGGTWHHAFMVDDHEIDLEVCVMNEEGAEGGEHEGHGG